MRGRLAGASALAVACAASVATAKPKVDPIAVATAKACDLPVERVTPTQAATDRKPPADTEGMEGSWWWWAGDDHVRLDDDDGDGNADQRTRELYKPDSGGEYLDCEIGERWAHGRWHLVKVTRYEGVEAVETTFRNDRPVHVDRHSAITG
jgi:hypothetical protein